MSFDFRFDHIAIQARDHANTVAWYGEFFGCVENWHKTKEQLQNPDRMPTCNQLCELQTGAMKFHIFDIAVDYVSQPTNALGIAHFCLEVSSMEKLEASRERWISLFRSGKYHFETAEEPTSLITSSDGMVGFYARDPNGIEFEILFQPLKP